MILSEHQTHAERCAFLNQRCVELSALLTVPGEIMPLAGSAELYEELRDIHTRLILLMAFFSGCFTVEDAAFCIEAEIAYLDEVDALLGGVTEGLRSLAA